jgi:hypothetical protein
MTGMKSRIELMGAAEKAAVGKVIVSVACSDGAIAPAEIKQLEKIYSSLGLDPSSVLSNIHQHSASEHDLVSSVPTDQPAAGFTLDANVLARHESATDDVRKLLNTIFTEEEPEEPESAPASLTEAGCLTPHIASFIAVCWRKNSGPERGDRIVRKFEFDARRCA